jgi:hypothetical protein
VQVLPKQEVVQLEYPALAGIEATSSDNATRPRAMDLVILFFL